MSYIITDECVNCGACEAECPNQAIYEGSASWSYKDGTALSGAVIDPKGNTHSADSLNTPLQKDFYYIVPGKCTECYSYAEEPQCLAVCPVEVTIPDPENSENAEELTLKEQWLFQTSTPYGEDHERIKKSVFAESKTCCTQNSYVVNETSISGTNSSGWISKIISFFKSR